MHALQNTLPKALQTTLLVPFWKCDCFFKMKHHKALAACSCPPLSKPLYSELQKPYVFTNVAAPSTVKWRDNTHSQARTQLGAQAWKPKLGGSPCNSDWRCNSNQVTRLAGVSKQPDTLHVTSRADALGTTTAIIPNKTPPRYWHIYWTFPWHFQTFERDRQCDH